MIFATIYSFITFCVLALAFGHLENPTEKHLIVALCMWVITGPGLVLFFKAIF